MNLVSGITGAIHLAASLLALIAGTMVLASTKGTRFHKRAGYVYVFAMLVLNGTAFGIYKLFHGWGPFHYTALISVATLAVGMIPALLRSANWKIWHLYSMYYSILGLYAALAAEILTRIPGTHFGMTASIGSAIPFAIGTFFLFRKLDNWQRL